MKNRPTRPTRRQKEELSRLGLFPDDWLVCGETQHSITVQDKFTGKTITRIKKEYRNEKV